MLKKIFFYTFCLFMCLATHANAQKDTADNLGVLKQELAKVFPHNRTINLVFHGHSVPSGYWSNQEVRTLDSYPYILLGLLKKAYPKAVINIITTAIGGEHAEKGAARFATDVLPHQPDVIFIDYALNDLGLGLERSEAAWAQMIEEAKLNNISVVLLTPSPDQRQDMGNTENLLSKHAQQIRKLAAKYGLPVADSYAAFEAVFKENGTIEPFMSHVNHPNRLGHELIANEIFKLFAQQKYPQFGVDPLKDVIAAMTIDEKALMVTGAKRREIYPTALPGKRQKNIVAVGGYTYPFLHLGIPPIYLSDGPAGVRIAPRRSGDGQTYYATAFPVATLVASGWDTSLSREIGEAMGHEALEYGVDILLAPAMNIHRDPLGGRSFEYYSEDPLLTGKMASAYVQGIQSKGVGASIKHFAANNQETSRRYINTIVSERALREIYLEGYRIAVKEAKPWTVMSSYNKINGVYTPQSKELLVDILRKEWGFDGFVLTDWYGGDDPVEQMKAHNDLLMPGLQVWTDTIADALRKGNLSMDVIDQNIENILNVALKTGTVKDYPYTEKPDFEKSKEIARRVARESMVLLKNERNTLPIQARSTSIGLFGNYSYKNLPGGTGSGAVNYEHAVSVAEGLKTAGFGLDPVLEGKYTTHLEKGKPLSDKADSLITAMPPRDSILSELEWDNREIERSARETDMAIITIMRIFGEGGDRHVDHFHLTAEELTLIDRISNAYHAQQKKVVVLLNVGGVVETASWKDKVDGILLTWQSGQEGGHAVADLVSGKFTPSGKLPTTFPVRYADAPSAKNFPGTPSENPTAVVYEEDIYVGYRYYDTFRVPTSFPFGFGLSYTSFTYTDFKIEKGKGGNATLMVTVENTGRYPGKEVVQVYATAPSGKLEHPEKELKAFAKTRLLQPGERETLRFEISPRMLSSFDTDASAWVAEKGIYDLKIAVSSDTIVANGKFHLAKSQITEKVSKSLVPQVPINTLRSSK